MNKKMISIFLILSMLNLFSIFDDVKSAGSYDQEFNISKSDVKIQNNGSYRIYGTDKTAKTIYVYNGLNDVSITLDNVNIIITKENVSPIEINGNSKVTVNLIGNNTLKSYQNSAAIEVNKADDYNIASVTIKGSGALEATGGRYAAAIGSRAAYDSGNIEILGGNIKATGGDKSSGIGGSYRHKNGNIKITGGTVTSIGKSGAAGIGGGFEGNGGNIEISGGDVTAVGSDGGSGIGGGYRGLGGNINITGGKVTATGGDYACGIGSGRYAKGSSISINNDADVTAFSVKGKESIEFDISADNTNSNILSGSFSEIYFKEDEKIKIETDSYSKEIILPNEYQNFAVTLKEKGSYTVSTDSSELYHKINSKFETVFQIKEGLNIFDIVPKDTCSLSDPDFSINDVILKKDEIKTSIRLNASGSKFYLGKNCSLHKQSYSVNYEYEIKEDIAKIATITNNTLVLNVPNDGDYNVTVTVKAKAGGLEKTKDAKFKVIKHDDYIDINSGNIIIDKNGVYTIKGLTRHYSINVMPDLDDVTIILDNVTMDYSLNTSTNGTPILISSRSKVNLVLKGNNTLTSNKNGIPINLKSSLDGNKTLLKISGTGMLKANNLGKGPAIGSLDNGTNTEIFLLAGIINAKAIDGPGVGSSGALKESNIFISDAVDLKVVTNSKSGQSIEGVILNNSVQGYTPGYLIQGKIDKKLPIDSTYINVVRRSQTNINTIESFDKSSTGFATTVKGTGSYYITFEDANGFRKYFTNNTSYSDSKYFTIENNINFLDVHYYECSCKITSPKFQVEKVEIAYDNSSKTVTLKASDSEFELDKECIIHSNGAVKYEYSIITDEDEIAEISGNKLILSPRKTGSFKLKIRALAYLDDISTSKDISLTVNKLSKEESDKLKGDVSVVHYSYISGYEDKTFRPDNNITRAEAAAMLARLSEKYETSDYYSTSFKDVDRNAWYEKELGFMQNEELISGYEDNTFRPENYMTRAEFTVLASKAYGIKVVTKKSKFKDSNGHWAEDYISAFNSKKYINGYEDNTFRPEAPITRAEVVSIMNRVLGRKANKDKIEKAKMSHSFTDLSKSHWAYYEIIEACNAHFEKDAH